MKQFFEGIVDKGRLRLKHADEFTHTLLSFGGPTRVRLMIDRWKDLRSDNQNRYYWGVVIKILSDELGYFPEEMHEALKLKFLRKESKPLPTVRSTTSLTTSEFEDYLETVRVWAITEYQIRIPMPGENSIEE